MASPFVHGKLDEEGTSTAQVDINCITTSMMIFTMHEHTVIMSKWRYISGDLVVKYTLRPFLHGHNDEGCIN